MNVHAPLSTGQTVGEQSGRIGPNAVLQLIDALHNHGGSALADRIFGEAELSSILASPPDEMVDECIPARLFFTLWAVLPDHEAQSIAEDAGHRTADYIVANRIPGPVRHLLDLSPPWLATRVLLAAIEKHAWTFAGSGSCKTRSKPTAMIAIRNNPLTMPGCCWHTAVLERLFRRLVSPQTQVEHTDCCRLGGQACCFELDVLPLHASESHRIWPRPVGRFASSRIGISPRCVSQ